MGRIEREREKGEKTAGEKKRKKKRRKKKGNLMYFYNRYRFCRVGKEREVEEVVVVMPPQFDPRGGE